MVGVVWVSVLKRVPEHSSLSVFVLCATGTTGSTGDEDVEDWGFYVVIVGAAAAVILAVGMAYAVHKRVCRNFTFSCLSVLKRNTHRSCI